MSAAHPVRTLSAEVARKIAAGEVIDRPNAIVRELLDNAVDSCADKITVETEGGGIEKIRIVDNGSGMTEDDLKNCARPHATSKISSETDLLNLTTLGFRGEALASIAAVCRLSIISGGKKMRASITEDHIIEPTTPLDGTIVCAEGLFENFPARRQFLKRPASEGVLCKATFVEKSLPLPEKSFRLIQDGTMRLDLPAGQTLAERFVKAMELRESASLFNELEGSAGGRTPDWSFRIVIGEPGVFRSNKKDILIFVNGRRIQEYSLVQAVEYGSQGYFPNGNFPVAAVFVQMNPALVDFNIHPAKKEARFKDIAPLHHGISSGIKAFFAEYTKRTMKNAAAPAQNGIFQEATLFSAEGLAKAALSESRLSREASGALYAAEKGTAEQKSQERTERKTYFGGTAGAAFSTQAQKAFWNGYSSKPDFASGEYRIKRTPLSLFSQPERTDFAENQTFTEAEKTRKAQKEKNARTQAVSAFMERAIAAYNGTATEEQKTSPFHAEPNKEAEAECTTNKTSAQESNAPALSHDFAFIGSALGTFLIAEQNATLFIIDKHAAHERMIFDSIMQGSGRSQHLLLPYVIQTESEDEDAYLASIQTELKKIGFDMQSKGNGRWEFTALNERWRGTEEDLRHALLDKKEAPKDILYSIAATTACKAAVKDGYILDDAAAEEIARGALQLPDPHCPHGRPCYTTITRENLFTLVRRTDS